MREAAALLYEVRDNIARVTINRPERRNVWDSRATDALDYLHTMLTLNTMTEDAAEGIAAFAEKRQPQWKGR